MRVGLRRGQCETLDTGMLLRPFLPQRPLRLRAVTLCPVVREMHGANGPSAAKCHHSLTLGIALPGNRSKALADGPCRPKGRCFTATRLFSQIVSRDLLPPQ